MTLRTPAPSAPRAPGCEYGGHAAYGHVEKARYYGEPGEACACGTVLRSTNQYNACDCCLRRGRKASKRPRRSSGSPASAGSEAATSAAPAARHISGEEIEMAANKRRKTGETKAAILAYLDGEHESGEWVRVADVAKAVDVAAMTARGHLSQFVAEGRCESRIPARGGGYRLRQDAAAKAAAEGYRETAEEGLAMAEQAIDIAAETMCADAPDTPPAPAPVDAPATDAPEHPADPAPAPAPETPLEPVPAADDLDYFNGLRRDWYDGKVEMDVDQLFAFATRMRDELLGKLTSIQQCHIYRLPVVAGDLATGEVGVHWIDGLDRSEVSAAIHDSEAPGVYESVDWKADPHGNEPRIPEPSPGPPSFAGDEDTGYVLPSSEAIAESLLQPFAGIIPGTLVRGTSMSRELGVLTDLEDLEDAARERVLQYAVDRWWLK